MGKSILDLLESEAREFLLKKESYCTLDLPPYFTFSELLKDISKELDGKPLKDFYSSNGSKPSNYEKVNHKLLTNKSGQYAWRPIQLIHPVLYVALVHKITEQTNWKTLKGRFEKFRENEKIKCFSLPVVSESEQTDKAEQITHWFDEVEQKSIELALDYEYLYTTDITDCYGSIYTHSISWAIHGKECAKEKRTDSKLLGNQIDKSIQSMSYGQTNGIPQGSVLMDFVAEIVLGYADLKLREKINSEQDQDKDFQILRYRDDYRIFVNNPQTAGKIIKNLTEVLAELGFNLNEGKAIRSNNVVKASIKPDKLYWITTNKTGLKKTLQEKLYIISDVADKYPNSGTVTKELHKFYSNIVVKNSKNLKVLISIMTDIAMKNPKTYPISIAILSKFIRSLKQVDSLEQKDIKLIIDKIVTKFERLPNIGHLQIWLQRITLKVDDSKKYDEKLCKKVLDNKVDLWCSDWLKKDLKEVISNADIIDKEEIKIMPFVISKEEVELFKHIY